MSLEKYKRARASTSGDTEETVAPSSGSKRKDTEDTMTPSSGMKRKRGRSKPSMEHVVNRSLRGKKAVVEFNPKGVPAGKVASEMAFYIGILARSTIPISIESWPKVGKDLKNEIWKSVEMAYVLTARSEKLIVASAANKWRQFKCELTTKYILPLKDQPDTLKEPPEEYDFIKQDDWEKFVNSRLTADFQKRHIEQKERRNKIQNASGMSQKGYSSSEAELEKDLHEDELDPSTPWKKGHEDNTRNMSHENEGEAAEIDTMVRQICQINAEAVSNPNSGSRDDVRLMGLRTAEHSSRVRDARESSGDTEDTLTPSSRTKRKRGRARPSMEHVVSRSLRGNKAVVEYNPKGVPVGKVASEMASYIGVLARSTIPISIESWPKVGKDLKNEIWKSIEMAYVLTARSKKLIVASAANKWRQFKCELTTKFIMPFKGQPDTLKEPPEEYDFIKQEDWEKFVNSRLTTNFQKRHIEQKERRYKIQNANRMSQKGYASSEAELEKDMLEDELDLSIPWKKGHEDNTGNMSNETVGEAAEIDTLVTQICQINAEAISSSNSGSSDDVRSMGLGTAEHYSRVRDARESFTPNVSHLQVERDDVMDEVRKMMEQQRLYFEGKIALLEAKISGESPSTSIPLPTPLLKGKSCKLAFGSINNIVSHGTIIEVDVLNHKVHGVPLGERNVRVSIDTAIDEQALLPIPVAGELVTVGQAVGSHVAWPKHLIKLMDEEECGTRVLKQDVDLPKPLRLLYRYAERAMTDGEAISVFMEEAIFGIAKTVDIFKEDIMQFMEMKEIPPRCITVYMRHLYDMLKQSNMANMVGLMDPSCISVGDGNSDHKSQVLTTRFHQGSTDQILLVPYNSGYHWMLTIISEDKEICYFMDPLQRYFMDPLRRSMREEEWKYVVNNAIRQFNIETGRGFRKQPLWKVLMGPKQPSNMECGYYAMRYMKEIIEGHDLSFATKWHGKKLNAYTQKEIDEVRCEWADLVSNYV